MVEDRSSVSERLREHWAVSVSRCGENIVTIESNMLAGRDLSAEDEACIEDCARQLLSFIGKDALLSAEVHASTGWQPIETAPNGTMVLFCSMKATIEARDWCFVDWLAGGQLRLHPKHRPTHWQPLPSPPTPAAPRVPADPDPNCKRCKGTGEEPNAQFKCPCRWRFTGILSEVSAVYDAVDAPTPAAPLTQENE